MTSDLIRTFLARGSAALGSIVLIWVLGRSVGADGVGVFALAQSILLGIALISRLGMDNTLMRYVGQDPHSPNVMVYLKWAAKKTLSIVLVFSVALYFLRFQLADFFGDARLSTVLVGISIAAPAFTLGFILSGFFKGVGRPATACLLEQGAISLIASFLLWLWLAQPGDDRFLLIGGIYALASWLIVLYGMLQVVHWQRQRTNTSVGEKIDKNQLNSTSKAFFLMSFSVFIQSVLVTVVSGFYLNSHDLGLFKTAYQIGASIAFVLIVINAIIPPKLARCFYNEDWAGLQKMAKMSSLLGVALSFPLVLLCSLFPSVVLGLFGDEFIDAKSLLLLIVLAQFVNVASGSVGFVLNMTGHEKLMRNIALTSSLFCVFSLFVFLPILGVIGAAISLAVSLVLQNLIAVYFVWRKLGVWMLPLPNMLALAGVQSIFQINDRSC